MKKFLSIIMSTSIIICSLFCFNSTALAGGWVNSAQEVEFDTVYTDSCDFSDTYDKYYEKYYDSYKLNVPINGEITIRRESLNKSYFVDGYVYSYWIRIFSQNDLVTPIYDNSRENDFNYKYNSAMGCYYENKSLNLKKGTYYFVIYYEFPTEYEGDYEISFSYKPTFPNTSIKKLAPKKKSFKINFKKCSNVSGYQVKYSIKKNMSSSKTAKASSSSSSKTVKSLKSKKKYYVKVRTYKTVKINGKNKTYYGKWSKIKTVKTK